MTKVRFGITASGYMARTHAEAIKRLGSQATLVAVWGGSRAPALAKDYGAVVETTAESLLGRKDIDAIVITTPHDRHVSEAMIALDSGKHIFVEKPMATTVADCDRMLELAARRGLVIGTGYNARFRVNPLKAKELFSENALGRVLTAHFSLLYDLGLFDAAVLGGTKSWLRDAANIGNIIDGLPHAVDLFRWFTGAEVKSVSALCRTFMPVRPNVEDTTVGLIEFTNGAVCSVNTTCALPGAFPGNDLRLTLIGDQALLELDAFGDMNLSDRQGGWRLASRQPPVNWEDPNAAFGDNRMKAYCAQMQSFIDGIHGKPMVMGNGRDGRAGVAACLAMIQSSRERRWVDLN